MEKSSKKTLNLDVHNGVPFLVQGAHLLTQPGFKRYVLVPIFTNFIVFLFCLFALLAVMSHSAEQYANWLPGWLDWIKPILWIAILILFGTIYVFSFTAITNLIAAPFNGMLSEKVQSSLAGTDLPPQTWLELTKRTLAREFQKLLYFLGRGLLITIGLLIMGFIPLINLMAPLIGLVWACWVMALQFTDYAADNNHMSFRALRQQCQNNRLQTLLFGGSVLIIQLIPILNLFVMSAAVSGGTILWLQQREKQSDKIENPLE